MVSVRIEPKSLKEFMDACGQFAAQMKITMQDALLEQAALACQDAAIFTPPMPPGGGRGLTAGAQRAGFKAVEGDIRKIFVAANDRKKSATSLVTNQIALAVKSGDFGTFQRIVSGGKLLELEGLNYIIHKFTLDPIPERAFAKAKNFFNRSSVRRTEYGTQAMVTNIRSVHDQVKGRFGGRIKKGQRVGVTKHLVQDKNELKDYIMRRQKMVGSIKSGWAACLRSLPLPKDLNGQDGPPGAQLRAAAWVNAQTSVAGYSATNFGTGLVQIVIGNLSGNVNGIADEANTVDLVLGNRIKQMPRQVEYRTQKPIDKFNNK